MNINDVKISVDGKVIEPTLQECIFRKFEILREHEDGTGFTLTTLDPKSAFAMAEKMAFSGNNYSIKLGGQKGGEWVVVVTEVAK